MKPLPRRLKRWHRTQAPKKLEDGSPKTNEWLYAKHVVAWYVTYSAIEGNYNKSEDIVSDLEKNGFDLYERRPASEVSYRENSDETVKIKEALINSRLEIKNLYSIFYLRT